MRFIFVFFVFIVSLVSSSCSIIPKVERIEEPIVIVLSEPYNNVDTSVYSQVEVLANKLNINPLHLMILINFETGGTFDPTIKSKVSSGKGLIQVLDGTAKGLVDKTGKEIKSSSHLIKVYPTIHDQLEVPNKNNPFGGPVFQYFNKLKPKKDDLYDLIACNFYPYSRERKNHNFKSSVKSVNGGIGNVQEYVELAIQRAKEKGLYYTTID